MNSNDLQPKVSEYKIKTCDNCGEPVEKIINLLGKERIVPIMCSCKKQKYEVKRIEEENKEKQLRVKSIIKNSLIDEKFKNSRFDNWDLSKGTKKMYNIGLKYVAKFSEMKKESVGLLIYGDPGNGKTHTTACIANSLIDKMIPVICVNIDGLLNRIKETYNTWGKEGEETILKSLSNADLLIIDDLGTEQDTDWAKSKIYNILDSRYRNGLPLIITTNLPLRELENRYEKRTYDRILEMCTPVFNDGKSIRVEKAKEKTQILKELLG
ncbi:ATP-binding protein [Clostridium sporogenes]|uniref:ATP-binding protein n=1 Tax=Clostridium sporogenes TaxID=1509 RepID=UPI0015EF2DA6|nr:ATP-binding protein [Clostridium sporogenes]MBA4509160.1 ATP-binding protein [Clostridium sporogenes]